MTDNKIIFEKWLQTFKRNADGNKYKAVTAYVGYINTIEKDLGMKGD